VSETSYAIRFDSATATIKIVGACDFATVEQLRDVGDIAFAQSGVDTVLVNCAGLSFCDSTVLAVFVTWQNRARRMSISLHFESVPAYLAKLLSVTEQALDVS
jgi:anti-anti-sigma factor